MNLDNDQKITLVKKALEARENSYAPHSNFAVGAALLTSDGEIVLGANVENSSYGGTICAERAAFCAAVSSGKRNFAAIAIVGAPKGEVPSSICAPCGICRQFMYEFCNEDFTVLLWDGQAVVEKTLGQLLPNGFRL